jgi:phage baseplate assembly protein W
VSVTEIHGAGLAFPLQIDHRGGIALAHGEDDIAQAIGLILSTTPGERPMRPEFGCDLHDLVFDTVDAAMIGRMDLAIRAALDRWEPRIEVVAIDFDLSETAHGRLVVTITYRVLTTNSRRNLVYPFYVIPDEDEAVTT